MGGPVIPGLVVPDFVIGTCSALVSVRPIAFDNMSAEGAHHSHRSWRRRDSVVMRENISRLSRSRGWAPSRRRTAEGREMDSRWSRSDVSMARRSIRFGWAESSAVFREFAVTAFDCGRGSR